MKKVVLIIIVLAGAFTSVAQNNVYGKKVVGLDSLVSDVITNENAGSLSIEQITADGSDNGVVYISGGGTYSNSRGSFIRLEGNEASSGGEIEFRLGNVTGSEIFFYDRYGTVGASFDGSTADWDFNTNSLTDIGSLTVDNLTLDGNTMSSSTGTIDLVPTGTQDVRITNGGDLVLNNSSSRIVTPRIYTSSGGSKSAVSYYINNDENTGIYSGQADHLEIAAGGIDIINIDNTGIDVTGNATFSGDVGIGANSTAHELEVYGSNPSIAVKANAVNEQTSVILNSDVSWILRNKGNESDDPFVIRQGTSGVDVLSINSSTYNSTFSGNVGIQGATTTFPLNVLSTTQQIAVDIDGQNTTATILNIDNDNANSQSYIRFQNQNASTSSIGYNDNLDVVGISHSAGLTNPDFYIDNSGDATFLGTVDINSSRVNLTLYK
jgi:hypothetical protein